ncbi:meiotic recombination protein REC8 homolog isoform X1 [Acanthaster planci]|uniref:Meiotic recombination protein REC8 homolog isoform X1 n=1 Tax=Acanthaster planci TaxID=133434 RepID=A0A8B7YVX3_ACAPL|nr:meiotic recombination protein REC8 homolog isoform X1 [Acanthaster planci]
MFFSQDILQRRGGKFGIVWLAATKCTPVSLSRRDYCTVSISKTCDDILKYICLEGQPLKPHGARPRLSLYLSSQLMFGVTRVYRKQVEFLSVEVRDLYMRFASAKQILQATEEGTDLAKIRMQKTSGFCTLQDPLIDMRESDFGVMRFQDERAIDPSNLPYIDFVQDVGPLFPVIMTPEHTISPKLSRINETKRPRTSSESESDDDTPLSFIAKGQKESTMDNVSKNTLSEIQQQLGHMTQALRILQEQHEEEKNQRVLLIEEIHALREEQQRQAEENRKILETFKNVMAVILNIFGLVKGRIKRRESNSRKATAESCTPAQTLPGHPQTTC